MSPMGREAEDETNTDGEKESAAVSEDGLTTDSEDELTADTDEDEPAAATGESEPAAATDEDEPAAQGGVVSPSPSPPLPTRPLPRRVPSQNPDRTGPTVSPPADHTVRHLLDILKRLP